MVWRSKRGKGKNKRKVDQENETFGPISCSLTIHLGSKGSRSNKKKSLALLDLEPSDEEEFIQSNFSSLIPPKSKPNFDP